MRYSALSTSIDRRVLRYNLYVPYRCAGQKLNGKHASENACASAAAVENTSAASIFGDFSEVVSLPAQGRARILLLACRGCQAVTYEATRTLETAMYLTLERLSKEDGGRQGGRISIFSLGTDVW